MQNIFTATCWFLVADDRHEHAYSARGVGGSRDAYERARQRAYLAGRVTSVFSYRSYFHLIITLSQVLLCRFCVDFSTVPSK